MDTFRRLSIIEKQKLLAAGFSSTFLVANENLYACGRNDTGELGLGDLVDRAELTRVSLNGVEGAIVDVTASMVSAFVVRQRALYACGYNEEGQLGLGDREPRQEFTRVPFDMEIRAVYTGMRYTFVVTESGMLYACGDNYENQLGLGDKQNRLVLTHVPTPEDVKTVAAGEDFTIVLAESGVAYTCGSNYYGQLGLGDKQDRSTLTRVPLDEAVEAIAAIYNSAFFVTSSGALYACGYNYEEQLGLDDEDSFETLTLVPIPEPVVKVFARYESVFAVTAKGELYACGNNIYGQLGLGRDGEVEVMFAKVPIVKDVQIVACGKSHTAILDSEGRLYTCGESEYGQLGFEDRQMQSNLFVEVPTSD